MMRCTLLLLTAVVAIVHGSALQGSNKVRSEGSSHDSDAPRLHEVTNRLLQRQDHTGRHHERGQGIGSSGGRRLQPRDDRWANNNRQGKLYHQQDELLMDDHLMRVRDTNPQNSHAVTATIPRGVAHYPESHASAPRSSEDTPLQTLKKKMAESGTAGGRGGKGGKGAKKGGPGGRRAKNKERKEQRKARKNKGGVAAAAATGGVVEGSGAANVKGTKEGGKHAWKKAARKALRNNREEKAKRKAAMKEMRAAKRKERVAAGKKIKGEKTMKKLH